MSKTDIMSQMGLWSWAVAAMILFIAVYIAQVIWTFSPRNRETMERGGALPLGEDLRVPASTTIHNGATTASDKTEVGHG